MSDLKRRYGQFQAGSRQEWRDWLAAHHDTVPGVWLVSYKKATGKPSVSYPEAVEEALCFGWIDSTQNPLDDERSMLLFTPRRRGSPWWKLNKERIERLVTADLMTPAGLAKVEAAKRDGSWSAYDAVEALIVPPDLDAALETNEAARRHFAAFRPSTKKQVLWWVESAKRPETRANRIDRIVAAAAENRNPIAYAKKSTS